MTAQQQLTASLGSLFQFAECSFPPTTKIKHTLWSTTKHCQCNEEL